MTLPPSPNPLPSPTPLITAADLFPAAMTAHQNLSHSIVTLRATVLEPSHSRSSRFLFLNQLQWSTTDAQAQCTDEAQKHLLKRIPPLLQQATLHYQSLEKEKQAVEEQDTGLDEEIAMVEMIDDALKEGEMVIRAAYVLYTLSKTAQEPTMRIEEVPPYDPLPEALDLAQKLDTAIENALGRRESSDQEDQSTDSNPLLSQILSETSSYYQPLLLSGRTPAEARAMKLLEQHRLVLEHMAEPLGKAQKIRTKFALWWKATRAFVKAGGVVDNDDYEMIAEDLGRQREQMDLWEGMVWKAAEAMLKVGEKGSAVV